MDLTQAAFKELASLDQGLLQVQMRQATDPDGWLVLSFLTVFNVDAHSSLIGWRTCGDPNTDYRRLCY